MEYTSYIKLSEVFSFHVYYDGLEFRVTTDGVRYAIEQRRIDVHGQDYFDFLEDPQEWVLDMVHAKAIEFLHFMNQNLQDLIECYDNEKRLKRKHYRARRKAEKRVAELEAILTLEKASDDAKN
ncbi:MAG: hypothetical protein GF364_04990 [Candidatus Lokiarchaeota archaeon]|nr:hypothetical protein [Candidatus Lokiarchaeota archaeon]